VVDGAAGLLGVQRVSVRLLDADRSRLVSIARTGQSLHDRPNAGFKLGEGLVGWVAEHGQPIRTGDADSDPRFITRDDMRERVGSFLGVPLLAGESCIGVLSIIDAARAFSEEDEELAVLLATIAAPHVEIARLSRLSRVDRLTGALNRHGLDDAFPDVEPPEDGVAEPLSVVMVDIDHFKNVNDRHGHATGDAVLAAIASRLAACVRAGDAVVRYGGEEFLLVLPEVGLAVAVRIAERARVSASEGIGVDGEIHRVTISLGVAERRGAETRDALIQRADAAMYAAKRGGRDRVEIAE